MPDQLLQLADNIAADLFTNGMGDMGDRLVLELPGKRDGGGLCLGAANRIANELDLSPKTIETYRENIKDKLGLSNSNLVLRVAAIWCWENGIDVEVNGANDN